MGSGNGKANSKEFGPHLFKSGRVVGRGSFGKVYVIFLRHDRTKMYAMKQLAKKDIIEKKMVESVLNERNLMADLHFPLLTNLHFTYQNETHLCMVMDLMMGGDVEFHLNACRKFDEDRARFYAACTILCLEYLHLEKSLIHRDLKPGNLLLDSEGFCRLTDFNVSTLYTPGKPITNCAGTRRYMAPEVLRRQSYSFPVDIWSLGVCLYEFLFGMTPWHGVELNDDKERANFISNPENLQFPFSISKDASDMIKLMLHPEPNTRPSLDELKKHPFFKTIIWEQLLNKSIRAPFVPDKNRAYVNANHDLEDQLVPEKKRKVSPEENNFFSSWDWIRDQTLFLPPASPNSRPHSPSSSTSSKGSKLPSKSKKELEGEEITIKTKEGRDIKRETSVPKLHDLNGENREKEAKGGSFHASKRNKDNDSPPTPTLRDKK